jgi:hypothetical protein
MNALTRLVLASGVAAACLPAQGGAPTDTSKQQQEPVDWKDLTRSGLPIKFYGFFRFDTYYNSARMDSVVIPTRVLPETKRNDDQFTMDPRLTRFGFDLMPVKTGDTTVTAKLEIDFANFPTGVAESRPTPRMRLGYLDIAQGDLGLRVGQDWDVISPLYPSVNAETLMWNAGNTGDRRPQIQGRTKLGDKADLKAALGLTGAINNEDLDVPAGERDGFDSGMPHLQVRLGTKPFEIVEKSPAEIGAWGAYGQTQTDTAFGGKTRFATWIAGIDLSVPLSSQLTLRGEFWTGANLGDFRGGIGQTINTATGKEIGSSGGWTEFVYAYTKQTHFHVGATMDDPKNDDLSTVLANANRTRNETAYAGTYVDWDTGVRTGFDVIYWQTEYVGVANGAIANTMRFDLWFLFNF